MTFQQLLQQDFLNAQQVLTRMRQVIPELGAEELIQAINDLEQWHKKADMKQVNDLYWPLLELIAKRGELTKDVIERLWNQGVTTTIFEGRNLSEEHLHWIQRGALQKARRDHETSMDWGTGLLAQCVSAGHSLLPEVRRGMVRVACALEKGKFRTRLLKALLLDQTTTTSELLQLIDIIDPHWMGLLLTHPSADGALAQQALRHFHGQEKLPENPLRRDHDVLQAILQGRPTHDDRRLHEYLVQTGDYPHVLWKLLETQQLDDDLIGPGVQTLAAQTPEQLLESLQKHPEWVESLQPEWLQPALQHQEPDIRRQATRLMGKMKNRSGRNH